MPRAMADLDFRRQQWEQRYAPHVAPINRWIDELRNPYDRGWLPYVAPLHGGTEARVLSILRDPGPGTRDGAGSGFLCTENDDGSAELMSRLLTDVGLSPFDLLPWNAYPWYIGKAPTAEQLDAGIPTVLHLLDLAPSIEVVLLQGADADHGWRRLLRLHPGIERERGLAVVRTFHPSPQALFTKDPIERAARVARREAAFAEVAELLG
ncbi:uracil-DNA glycosylase [Rathayibacter festucae]|uniref:uracil-DNA glycosylase n=1 Tax=Rathayibacter festucae TaxID=110937 RepID=UPI001FB1AC13|nr:uracil-DNA glycosylase [Rathayibacter festucae]MCJ1700796.1 uracil-DNA glycosylase [Rathayibacter festucae]